MPVESRSRYFQPMESRSWKHGSAALMDRQRNLFESDEWEFEEISRASRRADREESKC